MKPISTISEFLLQAGTQYQVFDLSRGLRVVPTQQFLDIEMAQVAHPTPRQQAAWFGIVFINKQLSQQHYIWFLKLPLDEQGLVIQAALNDFLHIIVTALGQDLEKAEATNGQLPENPYTFIPNQQQLADFNSASRQQLGLPASQYFTAVQDYFADPLEDQWQALSLQGISDFAVYTPISELAEIIRAQLSQLPAPVRTSLFSSLENIAVNKQISQYLLEWAQQDNTDTRDMAMALRALAQSTATTLVKTFIQSMLCSEEKVDMDILVVIAGRHWQHLQDSTLLDLFINQLALHDSDNGLFNGVFADLVQIPLLRTPLLSIIRQQHKSPALTKAIGQLFSQQESSTHGV
ncbi:DUF3549 family protein [Alteromonadaceae bacterium BrNp21-10]|nr:DUF3549 family protein [Alteromonadaceae bacterium BrNp21-10]